jgi:hypothetical protein
MVVGATGFEPVTSSVSGTARPLRRPALSGRMSLVSWQEVVPLVTAVVRCDPVVRGPDVARMWPQQSRAWKARPGTPFSRDPTPMAQVRSVCNRPLLTVRDRQMPVLRARGGHGRRGPTALQGGGDGHKLNRRVRPVHDDHLPRWQGRQARGSWTEGVRTRRQTPTASPVDAVRCADLEARDVAAWMQRKGLLILCG